MKRFSRCDDCGRRVEWFRSATTKRARKFDPNPVDPLHHLGSPAYPVEGGRLWWRTRELIEDLMVRRETGRDEAEAEAYDMPWYVAHACPNRPDGHDEEKETGVRTP